MFSSDDYRGQLISLLPPGAALAARDGSWLFALLDALAQEFARVDGRDDQLLLEAIPSTTLELLPDWERVAGIPDCCSGVASTIQDRRNAVVAKITNLGGQSPAYFVGFAASLGYAVTVEEFRPFRVGSSAGSSLTNGSWAFTWRIRGASTTETYFRSGVSSVGEPLASWGNASLECRMRRLKPSHTVLLFAYGD